MFKFTFLFLLFLVSVSSPAFADELSPWKDPSCYFVKSHKNWTPKKLIKEFVKRNSKGEFLSRSKKSLEMVLCPGQIEDASFYEVITNYKIQNLQTIDKETATAVVTYEQVGVINFGGAQDNFKSFTPLKETKSIVITAIKTPYGWRLKKIKDEFNSSKVLAKFARSVKPDKQWIAGDYKKFLLAAGLKK